MASEGERTTVTLTYTDMLTVRNKTIRALTILLFFIAIFLIGIRIEGFRFDKLEKEYPYLAVEDSISGKVKDIHYRNFGKYNPGSVYINVNGNKHQINTICFGIKEEYYFDNFLKIGDSLAKESMCDTIYLFDKKSGELKYSYQLHPLNEDN